MQLRRSRSFLLTFTALAAFAGGVHAQSDMPGDGEDGDTTLLPALLILDRSVATPGAVADTPLASRVEREELEARQVNSIEDLGRSLEPGVNFNRATGAVNIRGLEGPRVQTTVDGIPVPYLFDTTRGTSGGVDLFDFSSIAGVDVVRGADSSRAGGGALGGVLGLRTLEPDDLILAGRNWGALASVLYDSADQSVTPSAAYAQRFGDTAVLIQGAYRRGSERDNKGTVGGFGPDRTQPNPSDFDQHNLLFKLRHDLEGGHRIGLTAERFRRDRETDSRSLQSATGNFRPGDYTALEAGGRDRISLDYSYSGNAIFDSVNASLYWLDQHRGDGYEGFRSNSVIGPITRMNDYDKETFGLIGSGERRFETGVLNHRLVIGLDASTATSQQFSSGTDNCAIVYEPGCAFLHTNQADEPKVGSHDIGIFVDNEIGLGDSGLYLTPGARFDWVDRSPEMTDAFADNATRPDLPDAFRDSAISPKLRLGYRPDDMLEIYGQWAMGFRAPTSGELYSSFGGPGTYLRRGNDALEAETSQGIEIGARYGDQDQAIGVSAFHNRYRNFIEAGLAEEQNRALYPFGITEFQNLDRVRITGLEISAHKRFSSGFHVRGSLAYARGVNMDSNEHLGSVAPLKGVVTVGYAAQDWGTDLTLIGVKGVSERSDAAFKAPGYGLVDLTAWWKPPQMEGLTLRGGIYNLFDKEYYDAINVRNTAVTPQNQAFFSEPGRSFRFSVTKAF